MKNAIRKTAVLPPRVRGRVLALDCATRTGWAVCEDGKVIASGMEDFRRQKGDPPGLLYRRFRHWLLDVDRQHRVDAFAYEQAHLRGMAATTLALALTTRVVELAVDGGRDVSAVHTSTIKLWFTGNGAADKQAMHDRAWAILGRVPVDDNEADAVALGLLVTRAEEEWPSVCRWARQVPQGLETISTGSRPTPATPGTEDGKRQGMTVREFGEWLERFPQDPALGSVFGHLRGVEGGQG